VDRNAAIEAHRTGQQLHTQFENATAVCGQWRFPEMLVVESGAPALSNLLTAWPQQNRLTHTQPETAGQQLPFASAAFDVAVLSHELPFVERPGVLLQELARVAEFQVIEVPVCDTAMLDKYAADLASQGVANIFTPSLLRFQLHRAGLEILCDRTTTRPAPAGAANRWFAQARFFPTTRRGREKRARSYTVLTQAARKLRVFPGGTPHNSTP